MGMGVGRELACVDVSASPYGLQGFLEHRRKSVTSRPPPLPLPTRGRGKLPLVIVMMRVVVIMVMIMIVVMMMTVRMVVRVTVRMVMIMLMMMQTLPRPRAARVFAEHQGFDGNRHGVGRHADAAEIDIVEVP